ncbi:MAG: two component transcriptional regulator, LuxR family [Phycisphaerales bacterium]|nr:two component transcriptional regulator, LuxR family [Phycisphaerales bacterium]
MVDDSAAVRGGYRSVLDRTPGHEIVGEAEDGDEVVTLVERLRPDLVLMDVEMRRVGGLRATRLLTESSGAHLRVLMSSLHGDDHLVAEALRAGARGYLLKSAAVAELIPAIGAVMKGQFYLSRAIGLLHRGARAFHAPRAAVELMRRLTPLEGRLVRLIGGGRSDQETSMELGLSAVSFTSLMSRVMAQLALETREEFAMIAEPLSAMQGISEAQEI